MARPSTRGGRDDADLDPGAVELVAVELAEQPPGAEGVEAEEGGGEQRDDEEDAAPHGLAEREGGDDADLAHGPLPSPTASR